MNIFQCISGRNGGISAHAVPFLGDLAAVVFGSTAARARVANGFVNGRGMNHSFVSTAHAIVFGTCRIMPIVGLLLVHFQLGIQGSELRLQRFNLCIALSHHAFVRICRRRRRCCLTWLGGVCSTGMHTSAQSRTEMP